VGRWFRVCVRAYVSRVDRLVCFLSLFLDRITKHHKNQNSFSFLNLIVDILLVDFEKKMSGAWMVVVIKGGEMGHHPREVIERKMHDTNLFYIQLL